MIRTRVGYCGGTTQSPTYRSIGDHAETIQIDFDPNKISYEKLLEVFWTTHNSCATPWSRQYMSAIFYEDDAQLDAIEHTRRIFVKDPARVRTEIVPLQKFWIAEDYHQKYRLRQDARLLEELRGKFESERAFIDSTAVARINGYLSGEGSKAQLEREIERFGLSSASRERLRKHVR
ncbi:MAG: peptide-methionine (S)-S-oxide reductase [Planctomycetes bacterium]|nr:peptide-methionine (S)-S-oxide reductase [Planctomycetota bacterium]